MFENPMPVRPNLCQTNGILLYYNECFISAVLQGIKVFVQAALLAVMKKGCYFVSHVLTLSQYSAVTDRK